MIRMNRARRTECVEAVATLSAAHVAIGRILTAESEALKGKPSEVLEALENALVSVEFAQDQFQKASAV